jgi:superfamily II DNA/RNA helicase
LTFEVLVLTPTRELAQQISNEFIKFGDGLKVSCVYGGVDYNTDLQGTNILIATPGRLNELLSNEVISLNQISLLTLDEADQMLDMGFEFQIKEIVSKISKKRQTCLFSATWNSNVQNIAKDYCPNSIKINIGKHEVSVNQSVTQHFIPYSEPKEHTNELISLIFDLKKKNQESKILIFAATKKECKKIHQTLTKLKIKACEIHGDIDQKTREISLELFKSNQEKILIATDVASRGIDVSDISTVINFDFPRDIETYVHRIGRTGRAGKTGESFSFISEKEDLGLMVQLKKILERGKNEVPDFIKDYKREKATQSSSWKSTKNSKGKSNNFKKK